MAARVIRSGRGVLVWVALLAATLAAFSAGSSEARRDTKPNVCALETKERVVSIADVHGAFDRFLVILKDAGLIDKDKHWSGGKAIFIQTGDILDRGPDSKKGLDFLKKLEDEANKAGGRVVSLLGNHEVMRSVMNDRRYVSNDDYNQFRSVDSIELRDNYYEKYLANKMNQMARAGEKIDQNAIRRKFLEETPLGSVEMQQAFSGQGEYGQLMRTKDSIAIVNGVAYMHGGLSTAFAAVPCAQLNADIRKSMMSPPGSLSHEETEKLAFVSSVGPLWYRGLVRSADGQEKPDVSDADFDAILKAFGVRAIVVGHTVTSDAKIHVLFGGRLFMTDTGMLDGYGKAPDRPNGWFPGGVPSALEILGGTITAIYEGGKREVLVEGPTSVVR